MRTDECPTLRKTRSQLNAAGNDIERDDLVYSINEPDNYAVEEALQIVARAGGNVTVVTVGSEEDEEILRREMAMGANSRRSALRRRLRRIGRPRHRHHPESLRAEGQLRPDPDRSAGRRRRARRSAACWPPCSTIPFASLVNSIEVLDGKKLKISREIEGGNKEVNEIDLPCVLSIQTGINEPRYVGMRGIRAGRVRPDPDFRRVRPWISIRSTVGDGGSESEAAWTTSCPLLGKGAEMLAGSREEIIDKLIELVAAKGGLN